MNSLFAPGLPHCPECEAGIRNYGSVYHRVTLFQGDRSAEPIRIRFRGLPLCERHGALFVEGAWIKICRACGADVPHLMGLRVPDLCPTCFNRQQQTARTEDTVHAEGLNQPD